jgi:hypothetical protein
MWNCRVGTLALLTRIGLTAEKARGQLDELARSIFFSSFGVSTTLFQFGTPLKP